MAVAAWGLIQQSPPSVTPYSPTTEAYPQAGLCTPDSATAPALAYLAPEFVALPRASQVR